VNSQSLSRGNRDFIGDLAYRDAMMCARLLRSHEEERKHGWIYNLSEGGFNAVTKAMNGRWLVLRHQFLTLVVMLSTLAFTVHLYIVIPKDSSAAGHRPAQRKHTGGPGDLLSGDEGADRASVDIVMKDLPWKAQRLQPARADGAAAAPIRAAVDTLEAS